MEIGELIKVVLNEKQLKHGELAKMLGIKPSSLTALLKSTDMKWSRILEIERLLGVDLVVRLRPLYAEREELLKGRVVELENALKDCRMECEVLNRVVGGTPPPQN